MVAVERHAQDRQRGGNGAPAVGAREKERLNRLHLCAGQRSNQPSLLAQRDRLWLRAHHETSANDQVITVPVGSAKQEKSNSGTTKSSILVPNDNLLDVQLRIFSETAWP